MSAHRPELADLFASSGAAPIEYDGKIVRKALDLPVGDAAARIVVRRTHARPDPVQAICMRLSSGRLEYDGQVGVGGGALGG
jgi:hypothetical protein